MDTKYSKDSNQLNIFIENIIKNKWLVVFITSFFVLCSILFSLTLKDYYKSTALVAVQNNQGSGLSMSSNMTGLASLAGVDVSGLSGGDNNLSLALATLKSKSFFKKLLDEDMILENIMAAESYNFSSGYIKYDESLYNVDKKIWVRKVSAPYSETPSYQEAYKEFHKNIFAVYEDPKTGYITLSIEHVSPVFAYELLYSIINNINTYTREKELIKTEKALDFLNQELSNDNTSIIDKSISSLIANELQNKMMANISDEFLLEIIDEPFTPQAKSSPGALLTILLALFCGLSFSFLYLFMFKKA